MKTILVLGGFGFISTNLLKCIDLSFSGDYQVIIFDRVSAHPHGVKFDCVVKTYAGDFNDESVVEEIFSENQIDVVVHALSSTVPATSSNAQYDVTTNLIPTLKLLAIMDKYNVKDIIYLSSGGAIYGDLLKGAHCEEEAVYPKSSYGIVKLAIEKYLISYGELYGFNPLILRVSNPFGKYHYNMRQGIINVAIRKALGGETVQVWGDGEGRKDYIFVEDLAAIIMHFVVNGWKSDVYNVASGSCYSVNELLDCIKLYIPSLTVEYSSAKASDVQDFTLSIDKLKKLIPHFIPSSIKESIGETIKWNMLQNNE